MSDKKLWRPTLFSALGAGFKNDNTVRDGIHLRWNFDSRLGLPFKKGQKTKGNFKVYVMNQSVKSIKNIDLFKADKKTYRIQSTDLFKLNTNANSTLLPLNNKVYFIKKTHQTQVALDWHFKNVLKFIKTFSFLHSKEDKRYTEYMEKVMEGYRPFYVPTKSEWEISEVCAVDINFFRNPIEGTNNTNVPRSGSRGTRKKFTMQQFHKMNANTATKLAGDLSKFANISKHSVIKNAIKSFKIKEVKRSHLIKRKPKFNRNLNTINPSIAAATTINPNITLNRNIILSSFRNDVYVTVKAWNRNDQLIDQDWIGKYGNNPFIITRPGLGTNNNAKAGKLKTNIKLRAPGIEYITFEFVPNKPVLYPKFFNYVFCEDYCRNDKIWSSNKAFETCFNGTSSFHTPANVREIHYEPFKRNFNWNQLSVNMRKHFIEDVQVQKMLKQKNTYDTYTYSTKYSAPDITVDTEDSMKIPLLPSLMSASIDPSFANILGLYMYIKQLKHDGRDFKVEADFPFFEANNIDQMDSKLAKLIANNPNNSIFQQLKSIITDTKLCGLILAPRIAKKPSPPVTNPIQSEVKTIDLPNQQDPKKYDFFGDAKIKIPFKENEVRPYQKVVALALEKSHNNTPFKNIIEAEETNFNPLEAFSLLPGVYIPKKENGVLKNPMEIDDYFSIPAVDDNEVQYQVEGYDIFGRPSLPSKGKKHQLLLPCKAPQKPANLSSQIISRGDDLFLEVNFSLFEGTLPLEAKKQTVELCVHELPIDNNPPEKVKWGGNKIAKVFTINYNASGTQLNLNTISSACHQISWSGNTLNRVNTNAALCNTKFSNSNPVFEEIFPAAFGLAETGFRTYKLSWKISTKPALAPGQHQWACRIRIKGTCEKSNAVKHSSEPVISATIRITPPPPPVLQPILAEIPESTYADHKGDAYYTVDLNDFIAVGDRASKPMIRLYSVTIDKLFNEPNTIVNKNILLDQTLFLTTAKQAKLPYKLITTDPIRYSAENRFVEIKVPGNLEEYHTVGVIGCNEYLEEVSWQQAGILIFKTPTSLSIPQLQFVLSEPFIGLGTPKIAMQFSAKFENDPPAPEHPPKIQIFRKNNTLGDKRNSFIETVNGTLINPQQPNEAQYDFEYLDETVFSLNRYDYEAYLLFFSEKHGHYIKSIEPAKCSTIAPLEQGGDPTQKIDLPQVIKNPGNTTVIFEFDAGEYEFSLTKKSDDGSKQRHMGKIRDGRLYFKSFKAELLVDSRYTLSFIDPDISTGVYTLRLSYGQLFTWTKKTETTP